MYFSIVKCIGGRAKMGFKGIIRYGVGKGIGIQVVVAHHVIPGDTYTFNSCGIGGKQVKFVTHLIAHTDTKGYVFNALYLFNHAFYKIIHLF
ncbi:hypothetical protein D3C86_1832520 [compost metagenome]